MKRPPTVSRYFPDAEPIYPPGMRQDSLGIDQLAILVDDIDEAIEYLGRLYGWGPFFKAEHKGEAWFRGKMVNCHFFMAFCLVGELEIELLQYVSGECAHAEGEPGLFHLRLITRDMPDELRKCAAEGIQVIWGAQNDGQFVGAYMAPNKLRFRTELYVGETGSDQILPESRQPPAHRPPVTYRMREQHDH